MPNPPHYSACIKTGNLIFTSGQLPILDPETRNVPESVVEQSRIVLQKVEELLVSHGLDRSHIVKTTAFITDMDDWDSVNDVYQEFFGEHKPARSIIPCGELHYGCKIELEAIAAF